MALVDANKEIADIDQLEKDIHEAANSGQEPANETPEDGADARQLILDGDNIPEKFRGKPVEELVNSYHNLESAYGRMANDYGAQRKLTDQLLGFEEKRQQDLEQNSPPPQVTGADLLDKPAETLERYLEAREATRTSATEQRLAQLEASLAQERFVAQHPDYEQVASDQKFLEWSNQTPYRQRLFSQVVNGGDWVAANELLTEFKATQANKQEAPAKVDADAALKQEAKQASLESANNSEGKAKTGKVYSRQALIRMRMENPDGYKDPAFQAEMLKAYNEGRVK